MSSDIVKFHTIIDNEIPINPPYTRNILKTGKQPMLVAGLLANRSDSDLGAVERSSWPTSKDLDDALERRRARAQAMTMEANSQSRDNRGKDSNGYSSRGKGGISIETPTAVVEFFL